MGKGEVSTDDELIAGFYMLCDNFILNCNHSGILIMPDGMSIAALEEVREHFCDQG